MAEKPSTLTRSHLEGLYIELEKPLFNVVFRYVWNKEEAQDLVQETFVKIWKIRDRIDMATVKPLIYKICINKASSFLRRKRILTFLSLDGLLKEPEVKNKNSLIEKEELLLLKKVVDGLPSKLKETVLLTEFSDMSYDEAGKALGIPAGTVGSRRNKAISIMRERFNRLYGQV